MKKNWVLFFFKLHFMISQKYHEDFLEAFIASELYCDAYTAILPYCLLPYLFLVFILDNSGRINCLYSVGQEGNIYSHKLGGLNNNAKDIVPIIKQFNGLKTMATPCEISWRSDYRYVAVGFNDGSISVMSSKLKCLVKLTLHKKTINCLAWHHLFEGEGEVAFYRDFFSI